MAQNDKVSPEQSMEDELEGQDTSLAVAFLTGRRLGLSYSAAMQAAEDAQIRFSGRVSCLALKARWEDMEK